MTPIPKSAFSRCRAVAFAALLVWFQWAAATTIPERISFQNILENKDIVMGEGGAFFQDSEGFMWLGGTSALVRYDGYEFRQITLEAKNANHKVVKMPIKVTQHFYEDQDHTLWISTRSGIFLYNPEKEKLTRFPDDDKQPLQISTSDFKRIVKLPTGELIGCSVSGLFVINPNTLKYTVILPDSNKINWLSSKRINTGHLDQKGVLWLGTDEGLEKVDWQNKIFTLYKLDPENTNIIANNRVAAIVNDDDHSFWLGTSTGLVHFDTRNQDKYRYINSPDDRFSLGGDDVWSLMIDAQGVLWVGSDGGGVSLFDKENKRFINHQHEPGRPGALVTNQVRTTFEDKNGDIWVGNFPAGVSFFDRSNAGIASYAREPANEKSLNYNHVLAVFEDHKDNLWLGTDGGGLSFFDRATGEFRSFKHNPDDPNSIGGNSIVSLYRDSFGIVWTGFWGAGANSFDPQEMKFTRYPAAKQHKNAARITTSNELSNAHVWSINEDKNHDMWFSTHRGGLNKFDRKTKMFTHFNHVPGDPLSIADDCAWNTLEDSRGNFWVGTASGLCRLDREKLTFACLRPDPLQPNSLSNSSIISIFEDSQHRLWLGTDAGLNLYDYTTQTFTAYGKDAGFVDDTIRSILEFPAGTLWIGTNSGFSSFNPETKKIKNYNRIDGHLIGGLASRSGTVSRRGEIIFGGVNGLRIIKPTELAENKTIPPVVLTDFKIFADSVAIGGADRLLKKSINLTDTITLDYKKSMFVFGFAALNYRDSEKNRYAYKLEGFDQNWLDVGDQRTAKYTNLNPGKYVFKVRGSNNDGVWNEQGKSVTIIQLTPPWFTWWAYALYGFAIFGGLALIIDKQRKNRLIVEKQNQLLEIKVTERTAEVREKSNDIQVMLSNIPQGLFTVQSDGRIHPAYSQYLESIFETQDIAGRNASDLLFNGAHLRGDALDLAKSAIFAIIGEDELNFILNHNLLVREYELEVNGAKKFIALDWNPILDGDIVSRLMVSVRDATQMKVMESNLLQSEKLAALGALVAGIAHELNTPIGNGLTVSTTMRACCVTMKAQMKTGLTKIALEKFVTDVDEGTLLVNRNLERASELVSSFKQVAIDRTSAKRRKFSIREMLNEICLTLSPSFKRTPYIVDVIAETDMVLDSYPGPLGQVITNLLNNAIIHAFDGRDHGHIVVATENLVGGVNVTVTDDGVGISLDNQAKIFDPFFTTKFGSGGNGLGMHIVHNIVTGVLGGSIHLKSELGAGTCFTVFLPKTAPAMEASLDDEMPR